LFIVQSRPETVHSPKTGMSYEEYKIQTKKTPILKGIGIGIDREQTTAVYDGDGKVVVGRKGENAIQNFVSKSGIPVYSVSGIREVVEYLFQEKFPVMIEGSSRAIDEETKSRFDEYLKTYGTA